MLVINESNQTFIGWAFKHRRRSGHWSVYRMTNLGMTVQGPDFPSKAACRLWAQARAGLLREEYLEYRRPPEPPPPTDKEKAFNRVHNSDWCTAKYEADGNLERAVSSAMRASAECIAAIQVAPTQRDHLLRCAASRREDAQQMFTIWKAREDAASPPPPRPFTVVR